MAILLAVALFSVAFPIGLLLWWSGRKKTGFWPFFAGALCFVLFATVLEPLLHQVCLLGNNAISAAITASPVLYTLYAAFAAGIFEETGRLFGFRLLLKHRREASTAVAYGIGHGGIEVILVLGVTYVTYLLAAVGVPMGDEASAAILREAVGTITLPLAGAAVWERISAVLLHIALSMLVFVAAREKGKFAYYPLAILLHAAADAPAALYQFGVIRSITVIEAFTFVFALVCLLPAYRVLKHYRAQSAADSDGGAAEIADEARE